MFATFRACRPLLAIFALIVASTPAIGAPDFPRVDAIQNNRAASFKASRTWFDSHVFKDRFFLQLKLILVGSYSGLADGEFGPQTFKALLQFQHDENGYGDGVLSGAEEAVLQGKAAAVYELFGFDKVTDPATGLTFLAPLALTPEKSATRRGTAWKSENGALAIEALSLAETDISFFALYSRLIAENRHRRVTYSTIRDDFFVISGTDRGRKFYVKINRANGRSVGFSLSWNPQIDTIGARLAVFMASIASIQDIAPRHFSQGFGTPERRPSSEGRHQAGSGSGFIISKSGLVITNLHVVTGCSGIEVAGHGEAVLVTSDPKKDLAAIRVRLASPVEPARLADSRPALGQAVMVAGFPLPESLGSNFLISSGIVSGETGFRGASHQFSVSAAMHPGNSGGPVLNGAGHVVGVAVAKLNELAILKQTGGATGSGIGFAIDTETLLDFLAPFDKQVVQGAIPSDRQPPQSAVALARMFTVQVLCR